VQAIPGKPPVGPRHPPPPLPLGFAVDGLAFGVGCFLFAVLVLDVRSISICYAPYCIAATGKV